MNKSLKKLLLTAAIAGTNLSAFAAGPDISGYFDMAMVAPKGKSTYYRQQHLNLIMQHQMNKFKFFSELEFEDAPDLDIGRTTGALGDGRGRLFMERAYGEVALSSNDSLRMGQMLAPTHYYLNHYPSVIVNYTNPLTFKTIFTYNELGIMLLGVRNGFQYNVWTGKGPVVAGAENESGDNFGAKLGYTYSSKSLEWSLNFLGESYYLGDNASNGMAKKSDMALGAEFIMTYDHFTLWSEFGTRDMKATTATNKNKMTAYYLQGSYAVDLQSHGELIPFLMLDGYKQKETTGNVEAKAIQRTTVGLNYRPIPTISWKLEYVNGGSYKPQDATTGKLAKAGGGQVVEDKVTAQFIYFYN